MAKRQHEEDAASAVEPKRLKVAHTTISQEQLTLLERFAKELRAFVKAAKKDKDKDEDNDKDEATDGTLDASFGQLAELSTDVLPIFHSRPPRQPAATSRPNVVAPVAAPTVLLNAHITPLRQDLSAWTLADIPANRAYPPLPPIPDPALAQMALTHRGVTNDVPGAANYETLEFVGDAFIYHVAAELITQTFPRMPVGRRSQMREGLLRNANLARYTVHYGLDRLARVPEEFCGVGRANGTRATDHGRQKVNGDLFEAYVGALVRARSTDAAYDGLAVAVRWLRSLWALTVASEIEREARRPPGATSAMASVAAGPGGSQPASTSTDGAPVPVPVPPPPAVHSPAKVRLAAAIACRGVVIRYEDFATNKRDKFTNMPLLTVVAYVDAWGKTELLGMGTALSKKEAGEKAAERGLENGKLMKELKAKKAEFLARVEAEKQAREAAAEAEAGASTA